MSFSINTNLGALNAHRNLSKIDDQRNNTLERLSTGLRINRAADDASGLSIADGFHAQSLGIGQAIQNGTDATSLVQIADGALQESTNILNTIRTKAVQAASDGQTAETRRLIQNDIDRLKTQFDNIAQTTSFNGQKLLSGAFANKSFQIGANANQTVAVSIGSAESTRMGHINTIDLAVAGNTGGDVQLTLKSGSTGAELTLNTVSVQFNNKAENGIGALANEINRYSSTTGIQATAVVNATGVTAVSAGTTGTDFAINGVTIGAINVQNSDSDNALVNGINARSAETGVTATKTDDGKLTLSANDGRAIQVSGDLGSVAGGTAAQFSTVGHLHLVQSGVSDFQIKSTGAQGTGADVTVKTTVAATSVDSILATGSVIKASTALKAGSVVGGDVQLNADGTGTNQDALLKVGSKLISGSTIAAGTQVTGTVKLSAADSTLTQDGVVTAGTHLVAGSILAAGSTIGQTFTDTGVTYYAGSTLNANVTLGAALDLTGNTTLKAGSKIIAASTLASGSILGADTVTGADTTLGSDMTLVKGSILLTDSVLTAGSTLGEDAVQKSTIDVTTTQETLLKAGSSLQQDTVLAQGSSIGVSIDTKVDVTLAGDQTLKSGSILKTGSVLKAGTFVTPDVGGLPTGVLSHDLTITTDLTLHTDLAMKAGSTIKANSTLATNAANVTAVNLTNKHASRLADLNVLTTDGAQAAISIADAALKDVNATRASLGAVQNQLSSTLANLSVTQTNVNAAESGIRDVDFASEAGNFSRLQVLSQAGSYALSQANAASQSVLSLLQR